MFFIDAEKIINYRDIFIGAWAYENIECEDTDHPIKLCTYLNKNKHRILGHFIERDLDYHEERYLFIFVTPNEYKCFIDKELSYHYLLCNTDIYIQDVAQMYTRTPTFTYYKVTLQDIPQKIWPDKSSFYIESKAYGKSANRK